MLLIPYYTAFPGQLPVMVELSVSNVTFSQAATAKKVMCFDMELAVATSYDPLSVPTAAGQGTSAWAYVRDYQVDTATMPRSQRDVYVVAETAVAAGSKGNAIVMGYVTGLVRPSGDNALGQGFTPSMANVGRVAPTAAVPTTLVATLSNRKVVLLSTVATTSTTSVSGFFNGLGFGSVPKNVAYNAD